MNFRTGSESEVGSLLRSLAGSKPAGLLLELGTGAGVGTALSSQVIRGRLRRQLRRQFMGVPLDCAGRVIVGPDLAPSPIPIARA